MVSLINSWVQGIILAVIIASIIEIILPEGNNKKYIKTIIGIYILFVIIQPLINKISSKNINVNSIMESTTREMNKYETKNIAIETSAYIEETYKQKLKEDIKQKSKEKGYDIKFLDLILEVENEENYGQVNSIIMQITRFEEKKQTENDSTKNTVNTIQTVEVNISENNTRNKNNDEKNEEFSADEIDSFKEYLSNIYGTKKENIEIN